MAAPLTEIWHNNEPFMIAKLKDIPIERSLSAYCQNKFLCSPLVIAPFDSCSAQRKMDVNESQLNI